MLTFTNHIYQSSLISGLNGVVHGYSTRALGDARKPENAKAFVRMLTGMDCTYIRAQQIHGATIGLVTPNSPPTLLGVDGLVSHDKNILLEVHVADCVPLLFVDPVARITGVAHAGWKGTAAHITKNVIEKMVHEGASLSHIRVSIGPHIGRCCYTVPEDRVSIFQAAFGTDPNITVKLGNDWHLDIGYANRVDILSSGISEKHIDAPIVCTSCRVETFYSYRKETKETFGEIIGVIGCLSV